jgi:uncharacterized RDD family membrane protein YckC
MRWYYEKDNQKIGPVTDADIDQLAAQGTVTSGTRVWNEETSQWLTYGQLTGGPAAQHAASPAAQAYCSQCGRKYATDDLIQYQGMTICAACKTVFFQRLKEGATLPGAIAYAGFWIRVGAEIIDGIIMYVVNLIIGFAAGLAGSALFGVTTQANKENPFAALGFVGVLMLLQTAASAAYATFFIGRFQATPGKMAVGIMVVMPEGERVSYGRALGRYFAKLLSWMIFGIGYFMIAFDDEKRGLHDRICNTRVIKKAR